MRWSGEAEGDGQVLACDVVADTTRKLGHDMGHSWLEHSAVASSRRRVDGIVHCLAHLSNAVMLNTYVELC